MSDVVPSGPTGSFQRRVTTAFTQQLGLKGMAVLVAVVLWFVVNAQKPQVELVSVRFSLVLDSSLVLRDPLPELHAIVAGSPNELIKLTSNPPSIRRPVGANSPDTVVVDLRPGRRDVAGRRGRRRARRPAAQRHAALRVDGEPQGADRLRARRHDDRHVGSRVDALRSGERSGVGTEAARRPSQIRSDDPRGHLLSRFAPASGRRRYNGTRHAAPEAVASEGDSGDAADTSPSDAAQVMRVLGIETSCDETSAAVLEGTGQATTTRVSARSSSCRRTCIACSAASCRRSRRARTSPRSCRWSSKRSPIRVRTTSTPSR